MISPQDLVTIARALRIALGYESREIRIDAIKRSKFIDVRGLAMRLEDAELLKEKTCEDIPTTETYTA